MQGRLLVCPQLIMSSLDIYKLYSQVTKAGVARAPFIHSFVERLCILSLTQFFTSCVLLCLAFASVTSDCFWREFIFSKGSVWVVLYSMRINLFWNLYNLCRFQHFGEEEEKSVGALYQMKIAKTSLEESSWSGKWVWTKQQISNHLLSSHSYFAIANISEKNFSGVQHERKFAAGDNFSIWWRFLKGKIWDRILSFATNPTQVFVTFSKLYHYEKGINVPMIINQTKRVLLFS